MTTKYIGIKNNNSKRMELLLVMFIKYVPKNAKKGKMVEKIIGEINLLFVSTLKLKIFWILNSSWFLWYAIMDKRIIIMLNVTSNGNKDNGSDMNGYRSVSYTHLQVRAFHWIN